MSNANVVHHRAKAAEFGRLAASATSVEEANYFHNARRSHDELAANEEWMTANSDKVVRPS